MGWEKMHGRLCPICRRPIAKGDGVRWIRLEGFSGSSPVHGRCFERDWEFIEAGLEPFPLRLGTQDRYGSRPAA
jgi:hypothetical protein